MHTGEPGNIAGFKTGQSSVAAVVRKQRLETSKVPYGFEALGHPQRKVVTQIAVGRAGIIIEV